MPGRPQPLMKHPYKSVNWSFMQWMDIVDADRPTHVYLRRLVIFKTPIIGLYLHWIFVPDEDRDPHNHPFRFWSWVLKGGYSEARYTEAGGLDLPAMRIRKRWSIARTDRTHYHRILTLASTPTVTMILTGSRSSWSFLTKDGVVPQEFYIREKEARWASQLQGDHDG